MKYNITVCKDGFVSVMQQGKPKERRLGHGLPVLTDVTDILDAMELIRRLCVLSRCHHGGKTGTLIEPRIIGWPLGPEGGDSDDLQKAQSVFKEEYKKLLKEMGRNDNG